MFFTILPNTSPKHYDEWSWNVIGNTINIWRKRQKKKKKVLAMLFSILPKQALNDTTSDFEMLLKIQRQKVLQVALGKRVIFQCYFLF